MTITIIYKSDVVAAAPKSWADQYSGYASPEQAEKTNKLLDLAEGFSADDVNTIIGNTSWTRMTCDECYEDHDVLVRVGDPEPDYDTRWIDLCGACLAKATSALLMGCRHTDSKGGAE